MGLEWRSACRARGLAPKPTGDSPENDLSVPDVPAGADPGEEFLGGKVHSLDLELTDMVPDRIVAAKPILVTGFVFDVQSRVAREKVFLVVDQDRGMDQFGADCDPLG